MQLHTLAQADISDHDNDTDNVSRNEADDNDHDGCDHVSEDRPRTIPARRA